MDDYHCPSCDDTFDTKRGRGVHHVHVHGDRLPNRTCDYCGDSFYSDYAKKYCSQDCLLNSDSYAGENNPNYQGAKVTNECRICGNEFEFYPSDKRGWYCSDCANHEDWRDPPVLTGSDNPRWGGGKIGEECSVCGDIVERYPSGFPSEIVCCSRDCRRQWLSISFTGEGHPNWKGGGNEAYGPGWASIRRKALERDGYACVICGTDAETLGRNPDVHHIIPVRFFAKSDSHDKTDAHTMDNVVSLCVGCHRKADFGNIPAATLRSAIANAQGSDSSTETVHSR